MDLSRRAQRPTSIPESRRASDNYRPVTTAAYGTPVPLLIGQHRVPTTIIWDERNASKAGLSVSSPKATRYGLCEGPIKSVGRYFADKGKTVDLGSTSAAAAHFGDHIPFPWAQMDAPKDDASPDSISFECITDSDYINALASYIYPNPILPDNDQGETAAGQPKIATDMAACVTGSGATAKTYLLTWSAQTSAMALMSRTGAGAWSAPVTVCSASVNAAYLPASGAVPQPRIAAVGNLVHVVWSRLDQASEPVQIAHAWSTNGGTTWTFGQSLVPQTKDYSAGVQRLQISLHSSGEVWVSFQKRRTVAWSAEDPTSPRGVVVGYLSSAATTTTQWIIPELTGFALASGEVGILNESPGYPGVPYARDMCRGGSILALGSGRALLSVLYIPIGTAQAQLYALPLKIQSAFIMLDLPLEATASVLGTGSKDYEFHNVCSISWLNRNGFPGISMGWVPDTDDDNNPDPRNEGSTQIMALTVTTFAVLYNHAPSNGPTPIYARAPDIPATYPDRLPWGAWRIAWGTIGASSITWDATRTELTTTTAPGLLANAFHNGNGQIFVAYGKPAPTSGGLFWERWSSPIMEMRAVDTATKTVTPWMVYMPSTKLNVSVGYQFQALNGLTLAIWRENEENNTAPPGSTPECGIREVTYTASNGDLLPSVICKRLLKGDPVRGLNIKDLTFDDGPSSTWEIFDNYCTAMGIRFSLLLTSQQAAWPLVCDILESANAVPYRSEGLIKVLVRETATITANGVTYTPKPEHAAPCMVIPASHLRDGISVDVIGSDERWNRLTVTWKNRARNYSDEPTTIQDEGAASRMGVIEASPCDWNWITNAQVAMTCAWLRLRHHQRTGRTYTFAVSQRYMLLEPGDIVTIGDGLIPSRPVRILRKSEAPADWIEMEAEDVVVSSSAIAPPGASGAGTAGGITIASPVNLPIIFVALIGGLLQVWCLLSGGANWRGCTVQQSWDGATWETVGTCAKQSPTGYLLQSMDRLRVRPGQKVHPGLRVGLADYALADFSESGELPPWPIWGDFLAGNPGALLWVDGELIAYAAETDDGVSVGQCSVFRHGLYGTAAVPHPILSRVGAVTENAFQWPIPPGNNGRTCYWRFPCPNEDPGAVTVYSVGIPA